MVLFLAVIRFAALLLFFVTVQENPYGPEYMDPADHGVEATFPPGYELVKNESGPFGLVFRPKDSPAVRLKLLVAQPEKPPDSDELWRHIRRDTVDSFREDYPGGVEVLEHSRGKIGEHDTLELDLRMKESNGEERRGRCTVFYQAGRRWHLELHTPSKEYDRRAEDFETVRSGVTLSAPPARTWLWVLVGALLLGTLLWVLFRNRLRPEDT